MPRPSVGANADVSSTGATDGSRLPQTEFDGAPVKPPSGSFFKRIGYAEESVVVMGKRFIRDA